MLKEQLAVCPHLSFVKYVMTYTELFASNKTGGWAQSGITFTENFVPFPAL